MSQIQQRRSEATERFRCIPELMRQYFFSDPWLMSYSSRKNPNRKGGGGWGYGFSGGIKEIACGISKG